MSLQTLTVHRLGAGRLLDEHAGCEVAIPSLEFPPEALGTDEEIDFEEHLGWQAPPSPGVRFTDLRLYGVVEPSDWERKFVGWLAEQCGIEFDGWTAPLSGSDYHSDSPQHDLIRRLLPGGEIDSWTSPAEVPESTLVRRAHTPRGEARAAAQDIRKWLIREGGLSAEKCDDVIVLVPAGRASLQLWRREFERQDLPVQMYGGEALASTSMGRWVMKIAQLAGWQEERKSRALLRDILESFFWSAKAIGARFGDDANAFSRKWVRRTFDHLRRNSFTFDEWIEFVETLEIDLRREEDNDAWERTRKTLLEFSRFLKEHTEAEGEFFGEFRRIFVDADAKSMVDKAASARDDSGGLTSTLKAIKDVITYLARRQARGADDPRLELLAEGRISPVDVLRDELQRRFAPADRNVAEHGVQLIPHQLYDGRSCSKLIVAGLGEGIFPEVPRLWSPREEDWARRLGLLESAEDAGASDPTTPAEYVEREVERQIRLICRAVEACDGAITLSYAEAGEGTERVHPGPLLSLLVGGWEDGDWESASEESDVNVEIMAWADEVPGSTDDLVCWDDVSLFANRADVIDELGSVNAQGEQLRRIYQGLRGSRNARRARTGDAIELGGYTGRLPSNPEQRDLFSASSLETYGQCGAKYFYRQVLGLNDVEESGDELDPIEVGNLLHAAFHDAAQRHIRLSDGEEPQPWKLTSEGEPRDEAVERITREVVESLEEMLQTHLDTHRSLSAPIARATHERWKQAVRAWVNSHLEEYEELTFEDIRIDEAHFEELVRQEQAKSRKDAQEELKKAEQLFDDLKGYLKSEDKYVKSRGDDRFNPNDIENLTKKSVKSVLGIAQGEGEAAGLEELAAVRETFHEEHESSLESELSQVEDSQWKKRGQRFDNLNRHVLHSELSFGRARGEADGSSIDEPIEIPVDGGVIKLSGSIDRVDYDAGSNVLAARDYKSSRSPKSKSALLAEIESGQHLQLPIYGLALQAMVDEGHLPHLDGASVRYAGLEFPAKAQNAPFRLDDVVGELVDSGEEVDWQEYGRMWIEHHVRHVGEGIFPPLPKACPIQERSAYCDYEGVCRSLGFPLDPERTVDPRNEPQVEMAATTSSSSETEAPDLKVLLPSAPAVEVDPDALRAKHEAAGRIAEDIEDETRRETTISAGAGTGKTYNLVRRYLKCLESGVSPQEILAITFTRKAAGEMRNRVRQELLRDSAKEDPVSKLARAIRQDAERLRGLLLQLSAAPISTIDSLAGDIVRAADEIRELNGNGISRSYEVVTGSAVKQELELLVAEKFLDALEAKDERLETLIDAITVGKLRSLMQAAVSGGIPQSLRRLHVEALRDDKDARLAARQEDLLEEWANLVAPIQEKLVEVVRAWAPAEWESALDAAQQQTAKYRTIDPNVIEEVEEAIVAIEKLRAGEITGPNKVRSALNSVLNVTTRQSRSSSGPQIGKNEMLDCIKQAYEEVDQLLESLAANRQAAWKAWCEWEDPAADAYLAACVLDLCEEWERDFERRWERRGVLRHADIERKAIEALKDKEIADELAGRLPYRHIFVDETQDTSESQVELIKELRALIEEQSDGESCRMFWVGDFKQSIYRFRGAEVDVFERMVQQNRGDEEIDLAVNWRSRPSLLELINRLFSAMLPAQRDGESIDPGSEIGYEPLTWPDRDHEDDKSDPAFEIIAQPGKGFSNAEDAGAEDEEDDDIVDAFAPLERALVARLQSLLEQDGEAPAGESIAVLVHSWKRAARYREVLAEHGIEADLQGGRGLLETREVLLMRQWLEAALYPDQRSPLVAAVQGPGFGVSYVGLYCLRRGYGVRAHDGAREDMASLIEEMCQPRDDGRPRKLGLSLVLSHGSLDAEAAAEEWPGFEEQELVDDAREALECDARMVDRFRRRFQWFRSNLGVIPTHELFERLLSEEGIRAFWHSEGGGAQRVANLETFLDMIREFEASHGVDPRGLHRHLNVIADSDDPGSGGLDASRGTPVVITTHWQAKGREWPVVVLPAIHKTTASNAAGSAKFGPVRVVERAGNESRPIYTAEVQRTSSDKPFETFNTPASTLLDVCRKPNDRAELRRLFYVAVTRAKQKVIMTGVFDAYSNKNHDQISLAKADDWAMVFRTTTGLEFDEAGQARFSDDSPWSEFNGGESPVRLVTPAELIDGETLATEEPEAKALSTDKLAERVTSWEPVAVDEIVLDSPSSLELSGEVPEPIGFRTLPWPKTSGGSDGKRFGGEHAKGTAFHYVMEHWCFGAGRVLDDELFLEALEHVGFEGAQGRVDAAVAGLRELVDEVQGVGSLFDELSQAAKSGEVYHEVPVRFRDRETGRYLTGSVDLVWRDGDGLYHVIDYKSGSAYPTLNTGVDPLKHEKIREHYPQVAAYARGLNQVLDTPVEDFGLWFVPAGLVVRWATPEATGAVEDRAVEIGREASSP